MTLPVHYNEARERIVETLKQEGVGVLTSIAVKQTLKQKLGKLRNHRPTLLGMASILTGRRLESSP